MVANERQDTHEGTLEKVSEVAENLLPAIARKKMANDIPEKAGASFFYEVAKSWETDMLRKDDDVFIARNTGDLEQAFGDSGIKTVLIPVTASITKAIALRICRRHGRGKTVFYEAS